MALLDEIKLLKGIRDDLQDNLLTLIIEESEQRILGYINSNRSEPLVIIPSEISYIVRDVAIKRFNKLNSEGTKSDTEEGRKLDWESSYLSEYEPILNRYADKKESGKARSGTFRIF